MKKMQGSRYIPAEIRRQVLLEAGHACAIPACQFPATEFAHIKPYAEVREHSVDNIIALCPNHHTLYDNGKIDRKSMRIYKQKLQFLNHRYSKYELRVLTLLDEKLAVAVGEEVQVLGLINDGLISNVKSLLTQTITLNDGKGEAIFQEQFVLTFAAMLTKEGREFLELWKSTSENFRSIL